MRGSYAVRSLQEWDAIRTGGDTMNPLSATTPVSLGFGDRLYAAMREHGPVCVGIDPHASLLAQWGLDDDANGVREFSLRVVEALGGRAAAFKPQAASLNGTAHAASRSSKRSSLPAVRWAPCVSWTPSEAILARRWQATLKPFCRTNLRLQAMPLRYLPTWASVL